MTEINKENNGLKDNPLNSDVRRRSSIIKKDKANIIREIAPYASLGLQLVITIIVCAYAGWWIDGEYDTSPWFLIVLTFVGAIAGMVTFIRTAIKKRK